MVNRRLKAARARQGLTQRELGNRVGLLEHQISRLETGRANPDAQTRRRIAEVLNQAPWELFDGGAQ